MVTNQSVQEVEGIVGVSPQVTSLILDDSALFFFPNNKKTCNLPCCTNTPQSA